MLEDKAYRGLIVLALAFGFSANFIVIANPDSVNIGVSLIRVLAKASALIIAGIWSYYRSLNMRAFFFIVVIINILTLLFGNSDGVGGFLLGGLTSGISIAMTGALLFLLPQDTMKQDIVLGFSLSALLVPLLHIMGNAADAQIHLILLPFYLLCVGAVVFVRPSSSVTFSDVKSLSHKFGGWRKLCAVLTEQRESVVFMLVSATLLSFILGVFEGYASLSELPLRSSDLALLIAFLAGSILYFFTAVNSTSSWFMSVFSALMIACIGGLLIVLVAPDLAGNVSKYFNVVTVVAMIPVCVFSIEFAKEQSVSPVFICATMPLLITVFIDFGAIINAQIYFGFGSGNYDISKISAFALAAFAVVVVFLVMLLTHWNNARKPSELFANDTDFSDTILDSGIEQEEIPLYLVAEKGLSPREAQIALLFSRGRSVPYIAEKLFLAESTVKSHLKRVYIKLDIHTRQELIDYLQSIHQLV